MPNPKQALQKAEDTLQEYNSSVPKSLFSLASKPHGKGMKKVKSAKAKDGGTFEVYERPAKAGQDRYLMYHAFGNGRGLDLGTHPSADGALKFARNNGIIEGRYDSYGYDFKDRWDGETPRATGRDYFGRPMRAEPEPYIFKDKAEAQKLYNQMARRGKIPAGSRGPIKNQRGKEVEWIVMVQEDIKENTGDAEWIIKNGKLLGYANHAKYYVVSKTVFMITADGRTGNLGSTSKFKGRLTPTMKREFDLSLLEDIKEDIYEQIVEANSDKVMKQLISKLKKQMSSVDKIDPTSDAYKKMIKFLDATAKVNPQAMKVLADADVKFLSKLAKNRLPKDKKMNKKTLVPEALKKAETVLEKSKYTPTENDKDGDGWADWMTDADKALARKAVSNLAKAVAKGEREKKKEIDSLATSILKKLGLR